MRGVSPLGRSARIALDFFFPPTSSQLLIAGGETCRWPSFEEGSEIRREAGQPLSSPDSTVSIFQNELDSSCLELFFPKLVWGFYSVFFSLRRSIRAQNILQSQQSSSPSVNPCTSIVPSSSCISIGPPNCHGNSVVEDRLSAVFGARDRTRRKTVQMANSVLQQHLHKRRIRLPSRFAGPLRFEPCPYGCLRKTVTQISV